MFAVPGWSVQAASLVREEVNTKKSSKAQTRDTDRKSHDEQLKNGSKKRKREGEEAAGKGADKFSEISKGAKAHRLPNDNAPKKVNLNSSNGLKSLVDTQTTNPSHNKSRGKTKSKAEKVRDSKLEEVDTGLFGRALVNHGQNLSPANDTKLTPLQIKMRSKLTSARFRHLNEKLYTTNSVEAFKMFASSPELFVEYHTGFANQVKDSWPQNPVQEYVKTIKSRGAADTPRSRVLPLPRRKTGSCTIADLGCGDAPLARGCQSAIKSLKLKFHNFDLHASNSFITAADMANLPLRDGEADIAVFCLSLMGTNWIDFIEEAWRILRGDGKGEVWISEVKSRFGRATKGRVVENSVGKRRKVQQPVRAQHEDNDRYDGPEQFIEEEKTRETAEDETDVSSFVKVITRRGFQLREGSIDKTNKMFVTMVLTKSGVPTSGKHKGLRWTGKEYQKLSVGSNKPSISRSDDDEVSPLQEAKVLKPCVYKIR